MFGMADLKLESSDKNYLLVPLKLASSKCLTYEVDVKAILKIT